MAKTRIEGKRVTGRKTSTATKKPNQRGATRGVAKTTESRGKPRKVQLGEEIEVLTKEYTQAIPEAKKTSDGQENNLMALNEASPSTLNKSKLFHAQEVLGLGELEDIDFWNGAAAELRGLQFVIYAIGRLNRKEDVGLRNSRTTKRLGYGVDEFEDTSKYFHLMASTPTRILRGTEVEPIEIDSESDGYKMDEDA
ncbi:hypothetical protein E2P81_ATG03567 [Venturia nashicola]|uniref:Uncharacterized protein n=1 Tax=Venturia nashicola TaxID=86259 RepID=A0A4Z1PPF2_9PEZI|nr:hypothetical protein E6O75_ATG03643 [Venturia nashicola]TLD37892.1 hypothetical protein E2P81_ATG03567 [Venturia nashicola]